MTKNIPIEEYEVFKKLGEGQFGNVLLVSETTKHHHFALKCISKQ
jgi:serine/threonine protein kinase